MKTWDTNARQWINPVTVSCAHERQRLSCDGMASVVELPSGQLLCVLESPHTAPPRANCIRLVSSEDGGRTWSWQHQERRIVVQTGKPDRLTVSPWVTRLPGGPWLCVFATDEEQSSSSQPGTHPRYMKTDVKFVFSLDRGRCWSPTADTVSAGTHHTYAPGVLPLRDGSLLVSCGDSATDSHRALHGTNTLPSCRTKLRAQQRAPVNAELIEANEF